MQLTSSMPRQTDDLSGHTHRQFVGILGLMLPILLGIVNRSRPVPGLPLESVSAYYHSGAVVVFAGILCALAVFFFTYEGYENKDGRWDRRASFVAGVAAIGVAFFPTNVAGYNPPWYQPSMGIVHYISAITLFLSFIFFSLFLFPKSNEPKAEQSTDKRVRNRIYQLCGLAMTVNVLWIAVVKLQDISGSIFWPEVLALEFFAVSWLVKGKADRLAVQLVRQLGPAVPRVTSPEKASPEKASSDQ